MSNEHAQVVCFEELRRADVPRGTNWHEEHLVRLLKERLARLTVEAAHVHRRGVSRGD
ncbi:hypothetical protein PO002_39420 [Cupriavidus necator]|uniref:hypothetical protein n=1 Tax=Cupriavidus necator TaxID=106590 RepID=UPI0039C27F69